MAKNGVKSRDRSRFGSLLLYVPPMCYDQLVAYYVFQVSDLSVYGKQRKAQEVFTYLVKERSCWGFGPHTPNRKAIQPGDRVLFYLTGVSNQVFVGAATLKTGAYENPAESQNLFLDPSTLRIDLEDVRVFDEPKPRKTFSSIDWAPAQGGSSKISERDYNVILGYEPDKLNSDEETADEEMGYALEKHLEEFIVENWQKIDFGEKLTLYVDENGNTGKQYYTEEVGYVDLLAQDEKGGFVVIELKKGRKNDEVIGQVLRYMGWVRNKLCGPNTQVRGYIIVGERDPKLNYALQEIGDKVQAMVYKVSFKLTRY